MSIRRILLLSFLVVGLVPATVLTGLAFNRTRAAMTAEIEQGVLRSASAVSADIDELLHERMLNATTWNHLEVMQDLRLDDVDKRLSGFLAEMKRRHGQVYLDLHAADTGGLIVASSDPARIGQRMPQTAPRLTATLPGGSVSFDPPERIDEQRLRLRLRTGIESVFSESSLGQLVLDVDGQRVQDLLDPMSDASRQVFVLDAEHQVIASSAALHGRGVVPGMKLRQWAPFAGRSGVGLREDTKLMQGPIIVGHQLSRGVGGKDSLGWTTAMLQSRDLALAPVAQMAGFFAALLAATALVTVLITLLVAGKIARPVVALTEFTRGFLRPGDPPAAPAPGPGELGELNRSFVRLVEDLQRSQQTLVQASKLAALGEVTALLAHEVRTPLGILRSSAQMLRAEPTLSSEGAELLRIVETETERLNRLVSSMLDSSRTRAPQLRPEDMHALIAHSVSLLAAQSRDCGITVRIVAEALRFTADCDAEQITQVLLNLVMNALQILPRGGQIELRTFNDGARLIIDVADDGPGIPPEERQHIFEPFVFKREGGVGLGLAVVRQIVRSHGGEVSAEASPLGGARFRVGLPLHNIDCS